MGLATAVIVSMLECFIICFPLLLPGVGKRGLVKLNLQLLLSFAPLLTENETCFYSLVQSLNKKRNNS